MVSDPVVSSAEEADSFALFNAACARTREDVSHGETICDLHNLNLAKWLEVPDQCHLQAFGQSCLRCRLQDDEPGLATNRGDANFRADGPGCCNCWCVPDGVQAGERPGSRLG